MRAVEYAAHAPGQAIGGGPSSDLVDTGFDDIAGGRIYLSRDQVMTAWAALGHPPLQAFAGLEEDRDMLQTRVDELLEHNRQLAASVEEADSLREAIAFTLERGAVTNAKMNTVGLRHKPGQKRIKLDESLWPTSLYLNEEVARDAAAD